MMFADGSSFAEMISYAEFTMIIVFRSGATLVFV